MSNDERKVVPEVYIAHALADEVSEYPRSGYGYMVVRRMLIGMVTFWAETQGHTPSDLATPEGVGTLRAVMIALKGRISPGRKVQEWPTGIWQNVCQQACDMMTKWHRTYIKR